MGNVFTTSNWDAAGPPEVMSNIKNTAAVSNNHKKGESRYKQTANTAVFANHKNANAAVTNHKNANVAVTNHKNANVAGTNHKNAAVTAATGAKQNASHSGPNNHPK